MNLNIGCIETGVAIGQHRMIKMMNLNIGCIETPSMEAGDVIRGAMNLNIGCIETKVEQNNLTKIKR